MHILSRILLLHMRMHTDCWSRTQSCPEEIWKGERAQNLEDQAHFWLKLGTWAKKYQKGTMKKYQKGSWYQNSR